MQVKQEIERRALQYGYKEANLFSLNALAVDGAGFSVPKCIGLSHQDNYSYLAGFKDSKGQTFDLLYGRFCDLQNHAVESQSLSLDAAKVLEQIRVFVVEAFSDQAYVHQLRQAIDAGQGFNANAALMVRSTGKEDNEQIANPGGNASFANIENQPGAIAPAVGQVVASYFSEKSIMQRLLAHDDITSPPFIPVLLQEMIGISPSVEQCVRSGVMYSNSRGTQIQMAPGHGELVVNSRAPFDSYFVSSERMVYADIQEKKYRIIPVAGGLDIVRNPKELAYRPSASESVIRRLAQVGQLIETHYGAPRDIEFVYDPITDHIHVVQARPIPGSDDKGLLPSSVPPHQLNRVKKAALNILKAVVITPAKKAAQVVVNKNQVIATNQCRTSYSSA